MRARASLSGKKSLPVLIGYNRFHVKQTVFASRDMFGLEREMDWILCLIAGALSLRGCYAGTGN
jgi:hypothetical protein